ncbi:MAG: hypothetical protein ACREDF_10720, partial [Thermoplasmata archaeon]
RPRSPRGEMGREISSMIMSVRSEASLTAPNDDLLHHRHAIGSGLPSVKPLHTVEAEISLFFVIPPT